MEKETKCGIYMWTLKENGHSYIGRSIDIDRRKKEFLCFSKYRYSGKTINRARKKYNDASMWDYEILEICEETELVEKEKYYIQKYDTHKHGYNENDGGDGNLAYRPSEETKRKISESGRKRPPASLVTRKKLSESLKGHTFTEESKVKISNTLKEYFKHNKNPNEGKQGKDCPWARIIGQYDKDGCLIKIWYGTFEIIRENPDYKSPCIINVCKGRKKSAYGYIWKYIDGKK